jgi:hypothetical protein
VPERPWSELSHPEKLGIETGKALDIAAKILNDGAVLLERDGLEGADIKLVALVKETALAVISNQIKVDTATLTASAMAPSGLTPEQRRERARKEIIEAFAERPSVSEGTVIEHELPAAED